MSAGLAAPTALASVSWQLQAAEDLRMLERLHAREIGSAVLGQLWQAGFPQGLILLPAGQSEAGAVRQRMGALLQAMTAVPETGRPALDDDLAADYAAIYLTHSHRASPHESVWLDDDQLLLQGPTFAVRAFYRHHGLRVANWRAMPDDHLCNELEFVALMLEQQRPEAALGFLRQHLLQWLPLFTQRVAERADTAFYAELATLTQLACAHCADLLQQAGVDAATVPASPVTCGMS